MSIHQNKPLTAKLRFEFFFSFKFTQHHSLILQGKLYLHLLLHLDKSCVVHFITKHNHLKNGVACTYLKRFQN